MILIFIYIYIHINMHSTIGIIIVNLSLYIEKNILTDKLISLEETLEKLVISKLKCYYCKKPLLLIYKYSREQSQWTLDRIDNSIGHTNDNTVITCLKCNLEKRKRSHEGFKFTKQLIINKSS